MRRLVWALLIVLLVGYLLTGVVQVRPGERAVVRRFGRVLEHKPEPGLWVGLPWGMDGVDRVAVDQVRSVVVGYRDDESGAGDAMPAGQLLTGDHNLVNVSVKLNYSVRPDAVDEYVVQADRVDGLVARAVETVLAQWVASRTIDDVLLNGKVALRPVLLEETQGYLNDYRLGVQVTDASVGLIAPPDEVKTAFDDVAEQQTRIVTLRYGAEQAAESNLRMARAYRNRTEQETAAYVHNQRLLAEREAERFAERLRQYQIGREKNPQYLRQIWEEERGKLFAGLKANRQIGLLDHHLGPDGLDLTVAPELPKK
jgi:membrane protease subunit HflK